MQKVIFSELARYVKKRHFLFEKHQMETRFLCEIHQGSEHIGGFCNTHNRPVHTGNVWKPLPAVLPPGEMSFSTDKNFNLSSV